MLHFILELSSNLSQLRSCLSSSSVLLITEDGKIVLNLPNFTKHYKILKKLQNLPKITNNLPNCT